MNEIRVFICEKCNACKCLLMKTALQVFWYITLVLGFDPSTVTSCAIAGKKRFQTI